MIWGGTHVQSERRARNFVVVDFFVLSSLSLSFEPNLSPPNPNLNPKPKPKDFPLPFPFPFAFRILDVPFTSSPPPLPTPADMLNPFTSSFPLACDKPCSPLPTPPPLSSPFSSLHSILRGPASTHRSQTTHVLVHVSIRT